MFVNNLTRSILYLPDKLDKQDKDQGPKPEAWESESLNFFGKI